MDEDARGAEGSGARGRKSMVVVITRAVVNIRNLGMDGQLGNRINRLN